jgi:hypothetical protein
MKEVVLIAPVQGDPGLIAYECPSCRYVTSVLTPLVARPAGKRAYPTGVPPVFYYWLVREYDLFETGGSGRLRTN